MGKKWALSDTVEIEIAMGVIENARLTAENNSNKRLFEKLMDFLKLMNFYKTYVKLINLYKTYVKLINFYETYAKLMNFV